MLLGGYDGGGTHYFNVTNTDQFISNFTLMIKIQSEDTKILATFPQIQIINIS